MASLEQLQMLDDGDITTSSSNKSDDEDDEDVGNTSLAMSNEDQTDDQFCMGENNNNIGHHKKRVKLSLGGAFKAIISSSKIEQQKNFKIGKPTASEIEDNLQSHVITADADIDPDANYLKEKELNSKPHSNRNQNTLLAETKSCINTSPSRSISSQEPASKRDANKDLAIAAPSRNGTKLQHGQKHKKSNLKPKIATAPASSNIMNKEMKRQQLPKIPSTSLTIAGEFCAPSTTKRSSLRSIRISPMSSPGLLLPTGSYVRGVETVNGTNSSSSDLFPNSSFTKSMTIAGYTTDARTKTPHRGSSVQRVVDDMFDSNVKFCLRFPRLLPRDVVPNPSLPPKVSRKAVTALATTILPHPSSSGPSSMTATMETKSTTMIRSALPFTKDSNPKLKVKLTEGNDVESIELKKKSILMSRFKKAFQMNDKKSYSMASSEKSFMNEFGSTSLLSSISGETSPTARMRSSRIAQYSDIVPVSLTLSFPDKYIQKRLEYATQVNKREKAIFDLQEKQKTLQTASEAKGRNHAIVVPPLPRLPDIPRRESVRAITNMKEIYGSEDQQQLSHPLYLPSSQPLVDHLDKRCFHIVHGRYFGLSSNAIADPYFFGPNAPGIGGLNLSASTGLAIASTGGGAGSVGAPLFMLPAQLSASLAVSSKTASMVDK